jgi:hypothetical protein
MVFHFTARVVKDVIPDFELRGGEHCHFNTEQSDLRSFDEIRGLDGIRFSHVLLGSVLTDGEKHR